MNDSPAAAEFLEDPALADAVAEVEAFVGEAGWDSAPRLFALVETDQLLAADPSLTGQLDPASRFTPIAQDEFLAGDLQDSLAGIGWPDGVAGCVLVREILVLPPGAAAAVGDDPDAAARHPDRVEARLAAGVLRGVRGGACLMRLRTESGDLLRGADLAPGLVQALAATFD